MLIDEYRIIKVLKELTPNNSYDQVSSSPPMLEMYTWMVDHKLLSAVEASILVKAFPNNVNPSHNKLDASTVSGSFYIHLYLLKVKDQPLSPSNIIAKYKIRLSDHRPTQPFEQMRSAFIEDPYGADKALAVEKKFFVPYSPSNMGETNREIILTHDDVIMNIGTAVVDAFMSAKEYFSLRLKQFNGEPLDDTEMDKLKKMWNSNPPISMGQQEDNNQRRKKRLGTIYKSSPYHLTFMTDNPKPLFNPPTNKPVGATRDQRQTIRGSVQTMAERFNSVFVELSAKRGITLKRKTK